MALLHHLRGPSGGEAAGSDIRQGYYWCSRERDAADGLLLIAAGA